jgi:hypothetical protein
MNKVLYALLIAAMFWTACKTSRVNVAKDCLKPSKIETSELIDSARSRQIDFTWFNAKAKVNYDDGKTIQGVTANIRMQRDSVIWVSITALMGYEAARIKVTPDTFELLNRLDKVYIKEPLSKIKNYIPIEADIRLLQDLIVGNYLWSTYGKMKHKSDKCLYVLKEDNVSIENTFWIEPGRFTIAQMETYEKTNDQRVNLVATDYQLTDGYWFSNTRDILFTGTSTVKIGMNYSRVKWNEPTSFPFNPGKYED